MRHSRPRHIFAWLPDRHGTPRAGSDVLASPRQAPPAARRERCPGPARTRRVGAASPQPCERTPCGMQRRDGRRRHARNGGPPAGRLGASGVPVGDWLVFGPFGPLLERLLHRAAATAAPPCVATAALVHLEAEDARYVLARAPLWAKLAIRLQEEVREGGAKEGAVNVVAARHVVVVQLAAARAKQFHGIVAGQGHGVRQADGKDRLLLAESARARAELARLVLGFLRARATWGGGRGRRLRRGRRTHARAKPTPGGRTMRARRHRHRRIRAASARAPCR